ncbi:MAG: hypothetical protein IKN60_04785 [Bacteroidales bacterium]|nr:hypothetical protein [Bacteroidales bacterium]
MMEEKTIPAFAGTEIIEGVHLFPEIESVLVMDSAEDFREDYDLTPISAGKYKVIPWGPDNLLPNNVLKKIAKNDIVAANLKFNRDVCFGLGPKLIRVLARNKGKITDYEEVTEGKEFDFFERNDIPLFIMQQLTDINTFYNAFCELGYDQKSTDIATIRHREAVFSRWGQMNAAARINFHYYCSGWDRTPGSKDYPIVCTRVLDEFDAVNELTMYAADRRRLVFPAYMPSPGRPYYSRPEWYSIFTSGWYDHSCMVPKLKKAILKNQLGVKYIIYVSPEYFEDIFKKESIDPSDRAKTKERIDKEKQAFCEYLSGEDNANKAIMTLKKMVPTASGTAENKWIEIVPVKNDLKGGEYIDDTESTANIICYAMGIHSALIGATPGKNSNTLGGSNARELYMMKQALMKPVVDRCMRSLKVIKQYNKWDPDIMITIPEYIFTTLDQNKSGKEESTNTNA